MPMTVGIVTLELHLPGVRSLKAKRKVIHGLVDRLHARFKVSVAETGFHDLHQRAEIGIAVVGTAPHEVERRMHDMRAIVDSVMDAMVTLWEPQILEAQD